MKISVTVPSELAGLIEAKLRTGGYRSVDEVVCAGLRLLERAERLEAEGIEGLRRAWEEGIASGDAGPLDFTSLREAAERELEATRKA